MENWEKRLDKILEKNMIAYRPQIAGKGEIEIKNLIKQELSKAREEGVKEGIHEISKTLDTEITRWRSDEDGEFDVLRIGFRYFRSKDADDYYSSIEAIEEEDFKDYESI